MARPTKDYDLRTKTARKKLEARPKPYYHTLGPGKSLGYQSIEGRAGPWTAREGMYPSYTYRTLGIADDLVRADGKDILTFEQAVAKAIKPQATVRSGKITVGEALADHFKNMTSNSVAEYEQCADKHIVPPLGRCRVDRLTLTQLREWQTGLVRNDPDDPEVRRKSMDTANRIRTILVAALNAAFQDEQNGIVSDAAWRRLKPFKAVARNRKEYFEESQIRAWVKAAASFDQCFANLTEIGYRTGARLGELADANVGDFNARNGTLFVDGKTGPRTVTLTTETVAALQRITRGRDADAPLLPRSDGGRWQGTQHRPTKRALKIAKLDLKATLYSLRHSHISNAIAAGMPLSNLSENVGSSIATITKNYAHVIARSHRAVTQKTAPKLRRVK